MKKWALRISFAFLALIALALLVGFTYEQVGRARDASQLPPRVGQAVDIGGRTLNLDCSGQGTPTVVLETGGNSPGYSLIAQQAQMAAFTRTCWYDRAGVGWSDPPSSPRTAASIVSDLHDTLHKPRFYLPTFWWGDPWEANTFASTRPAIPLTWRDWSWSIQRLPTNTIQIFS